MEFKHDLHSLDKSKKKDAVKKVIAAMTVGKDVSVLFPDVVNCMQAGIPSFISPCSFPMSCAIVGCNGRCSISVSCLRSHECQRHVKNFHSSHRFNGFSTSGLPRPIWPFLMSSIRANIGSADLPALWCNLTYPLQTDDLELKKLVYLYVINYAKTQPDWAIMGVNTFVKVRELSHNSSVAVSLALVVTDFMMT